MTTCRKLNCTQSYLRIWGSNDPIDSDPSETKKWGLYGRSVKKWRFWAGGHWEKLRNSETKSLKINPKVPNRSYRRGLQTGHWRNSGSYSKKSSFGLSFETKHLFGVLEVGQSGPISFKICPCDPFGWPKKEKITGTYTALFPWYFVNVKPLRFHFQP